MTTSDGKVYGMRAIPHEATAGIYFNKRLLQEAGIDPESIYELQRKQMGRTAFTGHRHKYASDGQHRQKPENLDTADTNSRYNRAYCNLRVSS